MNFFIVTANKEGSQAHRCNQMQCKDCAGTTFEVVESDPDFCNYGSDYYVTCSKCGTIFLNAFKGLGEDFVGYLAGYLEKEKQSGDEIQL